MRTDSCGLLWCVHMSILQGYHFIQVFSLALLGDHTRTQQHGCVVHAVEVVL